MNDDATPLIHAYLDGELTDRQRRELGDWLRASPGNVDRFVAECRLHSELLDAHRGNWNTDELADNPAISLPFAPIIPDSSSLNSPFAPLGGFLFSYVAAAIVVAVGLLIGWAYHVPVYRQPASTAQQPIGSFPNPKSEIVSVGHVTGMVACRWADPKTETSVHASVPLGRTYALTSGLLEITYDSGTRVILEGPCTYEVESRRAAHLRSAD